MKLAEQVKLRSRRRVRLGPISLDDVELACAGRGSLRVDSPGLVPAAKLRSRVGAAVSVALTVILGLACAGVSAVVGVPWLLLAAVPPVCALFVIALWASLRREVITLSTTSDGSRVWPVPTGVTAGEVRELIARIRRDQAATGRASVSAYLVFFDRLPERLPEALLRVDVVALSALPDPKDGESKRRLADASVAWSVEIAAGAEAELEAWSAPFRVVMIRQDRFDATDDAKLRSFAASLAERPDDEAVERRRRTRAWLRGWSLPLPPLHLPFVGEDELALRAPEDVARRAHALCLVGLASEAFIEAKSLGALGGALKASRSDLCPSEAAFAMSPTEESAADNRGRLEAMAVLSWAMMRVERELPVHEAWSADTDDERAATAAARAGDPATTLRSARAIAEQLDRLYCAAWVVDDARLRGLSLDQTVMTTVPWRYRALVWLTETEGWDDLRLGT